jgi:hypothetical protein
LVAHIRVGLGTMLSTRAAEVGDNVMATLIHHMNTVLFSFLYPLNAMILKSG